MLGLWNSAENTLIFICNMCDDTELTDEHATVQDKQVPGKAQPNSCSDVSS